MAAKDLVTYVGVLVVSGRHRLDHSRGACDMAATQPQRSTAQVVGWPEGVYEFRQVDGDEHPCAVRGWPWLIILDGGLIYLASKL